MPATKTKTKVNVNKIDATLSTADRDKLGARDYDSSWTPIPHRCLPTSVASGVAYIYTAITGGEDLTDLPDGEDATWAVSAKGGQLARVHGPTVFTNESKTGLVVKWNDKLIPLAIDEDGTLSFPSGKGKLDLSFVTAEANGWDTTCLQIKTTDKSTSTTHILPMAVRAADFDSRPDAETLAIVAESEPEQLYELIGQAPKQGTGVQLKGKVVRVGEVEPATYVVTAVKEINSAKTPYLLQTSAVVPFKATYSERVEDDNGDMNWVSHDIEFEAGDEFIIRPNEDIVKAVKTQIDGEDDNGNTQFKTPFDVVVDESMVFVTLDGPVIKVANLPLGDYQVTKYKTTSSVYTPFLLQTTALADFTATTRRRVEGTDDWEDVEVEVKAGDPVIMKPNNALNKKMMAQPIVSEGDPGEISIYEKGEWNGFATAKIRATFNRFREMSGDLSMSF